MKIIIGNDHAAVDLTLDIAAHLQAGGINVTHIGVPAGQRCHYPHKAADVAQALSRGEYDLGILVCGTGAGMCIAANKFRGIRAVVCSDPYTAKLTREHNDANILCLGARVLGSELAKMIVDIFLHTPFEGGRHAERVQMIAEFEN